MNEKLYWLYDYISRYSPTFRMIDEAWRDSEVNLRQCTLNRQTFTNWKRKLEVQFGIDIECKAFGKEYRYYIPQSPSDSKIRNWLVGTISVKNMLTENISIHDRIILEETRTEEDRQVEDTFLTDITKAIRENQLITFTYTDFWENEIQVTIEPYFIKLFRQKWHVVGPGIHGEEIQSYAMDSQRMKNLKVLDKHFTYPKDFSPEDFYRYNFSTLKDKNCPLTRVRILAWEKQNFYINSVPLHHTQKEIVKSEEDGYSIFEYEIEPTYDFMRELMSHGSYIEVLEPKSLRDAMKAEAKAVLAEYRGDSRKTCKKPVVIPE